MNKRLDFISETGFMYLFIFNFNLLRKFSRLTFHFCNSKYNQTCNKIPLEIFTIIHRKITHLITEVKYKIQANSNT